MRKKRIINVKPQEFTENGERTVRYRGSDGKMHDIATAPTGGATSSPATAQSSIYIIAEEVGENVGGYFIANYTDKKLVTIAELFDILQQNPNATILYAVSGAYEIIRPAIFTLAKNEEDKIDICVMQGSLHYVILNKNENKIEVKSADEPLISD